jgi:integrase
MGRRAQGWRLRRRDYGYAVRFQHEGQRVEQSTGTADIRKARSIATQIYADVVSGRKRRTHGVGASKVSLEVAFANWLADIESTLDGSTFEQYTMYVETHFLPFFRSLDTVTTEGARDYVRSRLAKVKRKTVLKELSAMRGFLRWCKEQGHLDAAPAIESPSTKQRGTTKWDRKTVELDPDEVERILAVLPERSMTGGRPKDFFTVMWETGLRTATLQQLRVPEDYSPGQTSLKIRDDIDKARYGRELPLTERARAVLDRVAPEVGLIFGGHKHARVLRSAAKRAGLPEEKCKHLSNHDFRHARATHLASHSQNLVGVAYLLGHKHITTTSLYAKPRQQAARAVLMAVGGITSVLATTGAQDTSRDTAQHATAKHVATDTDSVDTTAPRAGSELASGTSVPTSATDSGADSGADAVSEEIRARKVARSGREKPSDINFVRKRGLEPPRPFGHRNLNTARLPVPPLSRVNRERLVRRPGRGCQGMLWPSAVLRKLCIPGRTWRYEKSAVKPHGMRSRERHAFRFL